MKLFTWIIEFKIKRKENKNRIGYLLKRLVKELEQQGHNTKSQPFPALTYFSVFEHDTSYSIDGHSMSIRIDKQEERQ